MPRRYIAGAIMAGVLTGCATGERITRVARPETAVPNNFYVGNRTPLEASPLLKLPIGAIEPRDWLRTQLQLEADGFTGHLPQISEFLRPEGNAWLSAAGEGEHGWEEVPYWLKGYGDLGYVLGDERIKQETRGWIEAVLAGQRDDGYFGPRMNLTSLKGKPDLWPHMIMLNVLQSYYEYSGDPRILPFMTGYFHWELTVPEEDFLLPYWQQQRAADNLASVYWLYNRTGETWLLDLAQKIHRRTANWTDGVPDWHGVNMAQAFRGPGVYYQQSRDPRHLQAVERNYQEMRGKYGQVPGGMYGADEDCRPGYASPRQGTETCAMAEMMLSDEMLLKITGDRLWADRCEDVAFNSLPASMTADLKALHYLTAPNLVRCDRADKSPGVANRGDMFSFNPHQYRCCQHNVAHAWPYFAEHLWLATPGNGLAAVLYAPSRVRAKVGDGAEVTIVEDTKYPFDDRIVLRIETARAVRFPLYLRVPGWCAAPRLSINGSDRALGPAAAEYILAERTWANGDTVTLSLPMTVNVTTWSQNQNCVSVSRGPLTYSLKIAEKYVRYGDSAGWPAYEVLPDSAWNYGLLLDAADPTATFDVAFNRWDGTTQPFTPAAAPIELRAKARRIPAWQEDAQGLVGLLQPSPVRSNQPTETVTLVPMGCARLRITCFPQVSDRPDATTWTTPEH